MAALAYDAKKIGTPGGNSSSNQPFVAHGHGYGSADQDVQPTGHAQERAKGSTPTYPYINHLQHSPFLQWEEAGGGIYVTE